jgi:sulfite reductase alpha subunit-like flavoprotein
MGTGVRDRSSFRLQHSIAWSAVIAVHKCLAESWQLCCAPLVVSSALPYNDYIEHVLAQALSACLRYNRREGRTLAEVLDDFPSAAPPLAWLVESAPLLQPRQFSIASSPRMHPGQASFSALFASGETSEPRC